METFGSRVKQVREKLNLKQSELGALFDCSHAFISAVENDKNKLSVDNLIKLLVTYNVNINYILGGIGEMFITAQPSAQDKTELVQTVKDTMKELFVQYGLDDMAKKISEQS